MREVFCRLIGYPVVIHTEASSCGTLAGIVLSVDCNLLRLVSDDGSLYVVNLCEIIFFEEPRPQLVSPV
ncbi:MAG: hypothetical protein RR482_07150 [Clostridia bacterium]